MTSFAFRLGLIALATWAFLATQPTRAVNVVIDYTYDDSDFFTNNAQARAAVEAAADFYSDLLLDSFTGIETPETIFGTSGSARWRWVATFKHPATGLTKPLIDEEFDADEYRIFVGARDLPEGQLGLGGPGGFKARPFIGSRFVAPAGTNVTEISGDFIDDVEHRGGAKMEFASWGGSIAFDSATTWHFNHTTAPADGTSDFFSVALHEITHVLGFGTSDEWNELVSNDHFTGDTAMLENGNMPVPLAGADDLAHWANNIMSDVLGTNTDQFVAMDPSLPVTTRLLITDLDAAALQDLGWTLSTPPSALTSSALTIGDPASGDLSGGITLAGGSAISVPESTSGVMLLIGLSGWALARRRR